MTTPRVLVVDDAPTVRLYHGAILRSLGFAVEEAGNGFEALEMVLTRAYDLLLVDVNMPQMDGYALVRRLRAPDVGVTAPVVTISTEAENADAAEALAAGANLYLVKPVSPEVLTRVAGVLTAPLPSSWSLT